MNFILPKLEFLDDIVVTKKYKDENINIQAKRLKKYWMIME